MTRKNVTIAAVFIGLVIIIMDFIGSYPVCDYLVASGHKGNCPFIISDIESIFFPIIPFFIFSLIAFKMQEEVYQVWWKFARVWVPLSMLAILVSPSYTSNWMFPIEKGTVSFFTSALFFIISAALIGYKYTQPRKN